MKIVGFETNNGTRLGVVNGDNVVDVQAVDASIPTDLGEFLRASNGDLKPLADIVKKAPAAVRPLAGLKFALPVTKPGKIICLGLNYLDHVKEGPQKDNIPKFQSIFFRMLSSLTPHLEPLMRPKKSIQFDYEGEMVVIIGKRVKHLTLENATDCVAGYAVANEGSIREYQRHTTSGAWARTSTAPAASARGWSPPTNCRRAAKVSRSRPGSPGRSCSRPTPTF